MVSLKRRLFRERRRFLIIALMTFIAGLVAGIDDDRIVFGIPFQLAYGVAFTLILTPVLMTIALLFPSVRTATESVAFSLPFICWMGLYGAGYEGSGFEASSTVLTLMFLYLVFAVYGGGWLDRFLPARRRAFDSKVITRLAPDELWPFLVVTPDTFDTYGGEKTVSMKWVEPGVSFVEVEQVDDLTRIEEMQTIEQLEPDARVRVRFQALSAKETADGASGWMARKFERTANGTRLFSTRCFDRTSPTAGFRMWVDDTFGRSDDEYVSRAEQMSGL